MPGPDTQEVPDGAQNDLRIAGQKWRNSALRYKILATLRAPNPWRQVWDILFAWLLFNTPVGWRRTIFAGNENHCPLCKNDIRKFVVLHRPYFRYCPVCKSLGRDRLGWVLLKSDHIKIDQCVTRLLHVAPEPALAANLKKIAGLEYISADISSKEAMMTMDISQIQYPNDTFDLIYCSHVLEHVDDDRKAMGEFWRVLKPGGKAVLLVPIYVEKTIEDPGIVDPFERRRLFGQYDHVRVYGPDFEVRLAAAGFEVTRLMTANLVSQSEIQKFGLKADETIFLAEKANSRCVCASGSPQVDAF
jgi:SAM-dependent methyltransferase